MTIDKENGTVKLPSGFSIGAELSQTAFRASDAFADSQRRDHGTPPWVHYHFPGGSLDGKELLVSLCFYDQMLVDVSITAEFYPPGQRDWSSYSLEVEAETKRFHDELLERLLGKSRESKRLSWSWLFGQTSVLEEPHSWRFPWGTVSSFHDLKGGGTEIMLSYGHRREEADWAYRFRRRDQ
jgi:hypothetical protein